MFRKANNGRCCGEILPGKVRRASDGGSPEGNPYLRTESRNTWTSRYAEVAMTLISI